MSECESDHDDHAAYYRFTRPQRCETAMRTLHGLVEGIVADAKVDDDEVKRLIYWVSQHAEFSEAHPFNEVIPAIQRIIADGIVDDEERADLLWLSDRFARDGSFYDAVTGDLQQLHGYLGGIIADSDINETELRALSQWLDEHSHLQSCWPYDEIESIVSVVLRDGKIDAEEHDMLLNMFQEFDQRGRRKAIGPIDRQQTVSGICAMCPEIIFVDQLFCFTGSSKRGPRDYLAGVVEQRGGRFHPRITNETNYLVVGADGNPCWAYACYGRKVEDAEKRRREGQRLLIVHEFDFWDAVADSK